MDPIQGLDLKPGAGALGQGGRGRRHEQAALSWPRFLPVRPTPPRPALAPAQPPPLGLSHAVWSGGCGAEARRPGRAMGRARRPARAAGLLREAASREATPLQFPALAVAGRAGRGWRGLRGGQRAAGRPSYPWPPSICSPTPTRPLPLGSAASAVTRNQFRKRRRINFGNDAQMDCRSGK